MLIKRFDRESTLILTTAFALSVFHPVLAQSAVNNTSTVKKVSKAPATKAKTKAKTKNQYTYVDTTIPPIQRRRGKVSDEDAKSAGIKANKFYAIAEQKEKAGRLDEAKQYYYKAVVSRAQVWGEYDPAVAKIALKIGQVELKQKHPNAARTWFKQTLKAFSKRYGSGDYELIPVLALLAKLESGEKDHEASASYYQHILLLQERKLGEENAQIVPTRISYIQELMADKDPSEAESVAGKAIEIEKKARGAASADLPKLEQLLATARAARASNSSQ